MDTGGYINEELDSVMEDDEDLRYETEYVGGPRGGQLKTKNGQKYIVNHRPDGYFIPRLLAVILCILGVAAMAVIFLLTYFLAAYSCSGENIIIPISTRSNNNNNKIDDSNNITIAKAGLFANEPLPPTIINNNGGNAVLADQSIENDNIDASDVLMLNEGWSPVLYRLIMEPDFVTATTNGNISIDIVRDTYERGLPPIVLDINDITIIDAKAFTNPSNGEIGSPIDIDTAYGDNNSTFIITIRKGVNKDANNVTLQVQLNFISKLTDTLQGFYRTSYQDSKTGERRWLASTQFSPIDARRAFPCFDRPDKKAQFLISIIREEEKSMTLSNMPSSFISIAKPGYIQEDFDITPKMSTYLVAFIVSNLVNANEASQNLQLTSLPQINVWTRPEVSDMTNYSYTMTTKMLPFFEDYFAIRFKLPKIDMVAVPDFGFNAMENWGLITFRESALLVPEDEKLRSSAQHTQSVTSVLAHELAHQWFGNLVTMKWWDDLWLKEGFANYMSYLAIENIHPSWQIMDFFSINDLQRAMELDSDEQSHPISFPVSKPEDIRRIFDAISYSKGASIIRMMNSFLGEKTFITAIRSYLKTFQYSNAVQDDLWEVMTRYAHQYETLPQEYDIKEIMDTWTIQAGYPVITVRRNGTNVHISQQRYMLPEVNLNDTSRWFIPITIETKAQRTNDTIPQYWMNNSREIVIENIVEPTHWLLVNIKRASYYRVNYDYDSWVILGLAYETFPEVIKAQLIDDALNLARAEVLSYDIPLTLLLKLYARFQDVLPWAAATPGIQYLTNMLNREPAYEHFRAVMRYILKPIYEHMGFDEIDNETHVQLMHRRRMIEHACFFGHDRCTNRAQLLFREWMRDKTRNIISPNLKDVIYCTALREGSFQEWYFAYNQYLDTTSASEKEVILTALGCTTKPWLLSKYLNMTISPISGIRKQDGARAFSSVARNSVGYEIAFDFLVSHIEEISDYFGDGFSTLSKMIQSVTTYMNKDYQYEQFEKFAEKARELNLTSIETSIVLAQKDVKNNIFWRSRSYYKLQEYLESLTRALHINLY